MSKLLSANFARMKKSKVFWVCFIFMIGFGLFLIISRYVQFKRFDMMEEAYVEGTLLSYSVVMGIVFAVFTSLFIGTEYNDGTIRNKLIVGHTRINVYLANLITCCTAAVIMCLGYIVAYLIPGAVLIGTFQMDFTSIVLTLLTTFATAIAMTSIYTLVAMLNQSRAVVAVICLVGFFVMLFVSSYIQARLTQPEMYEAYAYTVDGVEIVEEAEPNPMYLRGVSRDIYEFFNNFLPTGATLQYPYWDMEPLPWFALYSGIITLFCGALGIVLFKRKNLK